MNKSGIYLNIVLTVYGLATAFAVLPQFKDWAGILAAIAIGANTIAHIWFPTPSTPATPAA